MSCSRPARLAALTSAPSSAGHHAGDMADLDGVLQHVLAVAGAVVQAAQQLHAAPDAGRARRVSSTARSPSELDDGVHLAAGLLHHLLDAGGVDAAVGNELLQSQTRATSRRTGSKQETVMASGVSSMMRSTPVSGLQRADVAALAADDAALHLVVGQGHHADGDLRHMVGGAPLDGGGHDLAGALVGLVLGARLDLLDLQRRLVRDLGLHLRDQVILGLLRGEAGDALEHLGLAALDELDLLLLLVHSGVLLGKGFFLLFDHLGLVIEILFLLLQTALLLLQLGAALLHFLLVFAAVFQNLFFCFKKCLSLFVFRTLDGLVDDARGFVLRAGDFFFRYALAVANAEEEKDHRRNSERSDGYDPTCCGQRSFLLCCDGFRVCSTKYCAR